MTILQVQNVNKSFAGLRALNDVNLTVERGSVHAIIGPNGAGKSTLLNCFVGRLTPDVGSVMFDGHSLIGRTPHEINQVGVVRVFQTPEIFADRLHGHPRERDLRCTAVVARRQRQPEHARRELGVFVEHLVEVAHPEEQDRALMPRLDLPVLLHERRRDGTAHRRLAPFALGSSVTKPMMPRSLSAATSAAAACRVG